VRDTSEAIRDIALDDPSRPCPVCTADLTQCCNRTPTGSKTVRARSKQWFIDGFQDESDSSLNYLVSTGGNAQSTLPHHCSIL
jgi:hypothetical protein